MRKWDTETGFFCTNLQLVDSSREKNPSPVSCVLLQVLGDFDLGLLDRGPGLPSQGHAQNSFAYISELSNTIVTLKNREESEIHRERESVTKEKSFSESINFGQFNMTNL
jgi:hypothetical protein